MRILIGAALALSVLLAAPPIAAHATDRLPQRSTAASTVPVAPVEGRTPEAAKSQADDALSRRAKGPRTPWRRHGWRALGGKTRTLLTSADGFDQRALATSLHTTAS